MLDIVCLDVVQPRHARRCLRCGRHDRDLSAQRDDVLPVGLQLRGGRRVARQPVLFDCHGAGIAERREAARDVLHRRAHAVEVGGVVKALVGLILHVRARAVGDESQKAVVERERVVGTDARRGDGGEGDGVGVVRRPLDRSRPRALDERPGVGRAVDRAAHIDDLARQRDAQDLRAHSISTAMTIVAPASTGLGVMVADLMTGTEVSSVTLRVTVEALPAASVAVMTMVFAPSASVTALLNAPPAPTATPP